MNTPVAEIPREELGIARDETMEAMIECKNSAQSLKEDAVALEARADSFNLPENVKRDLRDLCRQVRDLADRVEEQEKVERSRLEAIQERIEDET